ncbi:MAG: hypothetical protein IJA63_05520, partial [Akkermansia sp.]|nr:hypothetical protein [Akkermansia sp.]
SRDFPSNFLFHGSLPPRSCSSGLGFRIIAAPRGLSPQCAYRVGRTKRRNRHAGCAFFYAQNQSKRQPKRYAHNTKAGKTMQ